MAEQERPPAPPPQRGIWRQGYRFGTIGCVGCATFVVVAVVVIVVLLLLLGHAGQSST
jgi:hypothetical protein